MASKDDTYVDPIYPAQGVPPGYEYQPYQTPEYGALPGQVHPGYAQQMQGTTNPMVTAQERPVVVVVEADDGVYTDCDSCPDNAAGRCCRSFWICERGHKIYSPFGKGIGWILVLILIYIIAVPIVFVIVVAIYVLYNYN
ncbi:uncharacterized protein LOC144350889 [Saccoglossus kowalevskii]